MPRIPRRLLIMVAACCCGIAAAQAPTRDEALWSAVRAAQPALIDTLRELVSIESGTTDRDGLARIADDVERRLKAIGAAVERRKSDGFPDVLIGRWQGSGKRRLMLIAHMDTVYPPGTLAAQPIKHDGNRLYGPGIADDKGGVAIILHSIALLHKAGWRDYAKLTVVFNADEESGSRGSGEVIAGEGAEHDVVLSYEPTSASTTPQGEGVLLAAAGTGRAFLQVKGRASHAGAAPQLGRNALVELAHQVLQTENVAKDIPGAQLNWTTFVTGVIPNQIPEQATAGGDVRLTRPDAAEKLLAALQAKIKEGKRVPDTEATITLQLGRPPFVGDERTQALAKRAQAIYAELDGRKLALHPITGGATDASFAQRSGKAAVLESMGLPGAGYHARDEYIELDAVAPRLYLSCRMLMQLGRE